MVWLYLDGSLVNNVSLEDMTGSVGASSGNIAMIGRNSQSGIFDFEWNGSIDEVRIWKRPLSSNQILELYNNNTNILTYPETLENEKWKVTGIPINETDDGTPSDSNSLTVNRLSIQAAPTLNATTTDNTTSDNITAWIDITSSFGDPTKGIYNFYMNGSSITDLYYAFEGYSYLTTSATNGSTIDYSGNGYNATVVGADWNMGGHDGFGAYTLDGVDDYIVADSTSAADFTKNDYYTLCSWIYPTVSPFEEILSNYNNSHGYYLDKVAPGELLHGYIGNPSFSTQVYSNISLTLNAWQHVCMSFNDSFSGIELYINGTRVTNETSYSNFGPEISSYSSHYPFTIGARSWPIGFRNFNGSIDEVMVFNRVLSQEQISALYNNLTNTIVSQETQVGDIWNATVTVTDGKDDGTTNWTNSITITEGCTDNDGDGFNQSQSSCGTVFDCDDTDTNTLPPYDDMSITSNTVLCNGTYNIADSGSTGVIIFNANSVNLTCNNTLINGSGTGVGITTQGFNNLIISGCNVSNYEDAIDTGPATYNNQILNNIIDATQYAIALRGDNYTIQNNNITDGYIYLTSDAYNNNITNNIIEDTSYCVKSEGSNYTTFDNNNCTAALISLINGTSNIITNNYIDRYVLTENEFNATISNNNIDTTFVLSIITTNSSNLLIFNNTATREFRIIETNDTQIIANNITLPVIGEAILINTGSLRNNITNNTINNGFIDIQNSDEHILTNNYINTSNASNTKLTLTSADNNTVIYYNPNGEIEWNLIASGSSKAPLILNSNPIISNNFVEFTPATSDILNNSNATITLYDVIGITYPEVLRNGVTCDSSICSDVVDLGGDDYQFNVTQFSNYTLTSGTNSALGIWDDNDPEGGSQGKGTGTQISFYANYTNVTDGTPITAAMGGLCNVSYNVTPNGPFNMTYNGTSTLWEYNRSFSFEGTYNWNITCNALGFSGQNLTDTIVIGNNPPTQGIPILNSTFGTNSSSENLTVYNQSTSDPNGDPVKNIYNWYMNDSSLTILNMPFEGGSNSTFTKDYSPYGNNGTVIGAVWNSSGGYDDTGAYEFNGSNNNFVNITNHSSLNFDLTNGNGFSVEARFRSLDSTVVDYLLIKGVAGVGNSYYSIVKYSGNILEYRIGNGSNVLINEGITLVNDSEWHQVVLIVNSTEVKAYIDGQEDMSQTTPISGIVGTSGHLSIGASNSGTQSWNGTIDEVRIWNRSLSEQQVIALYNNQSNVIVSQETNLGEVWNATVTPNDGNLDGATNWSNSVEILLSCTDNDGDGFNLSEAGCGTVFDCNDNNASILPPSDDMLISGNTVLCNGTYNIEDSGSEGVV
ncbi:MAG: LamG domain-containing protein, partial [Nanoarchaeota archaeon]|nr:LamG domain-containing protein [Nanoarchaeota archaeon]